MKLQVKFFSLLREVTGLSDLTVDFQGHTAGELWAQLEKQFPTLAPFRTSRAIAVNRQHSQEDLILKEGDEVAFFPPLSGG